MSNKAKLLASAQKNLQKNQVAKAIKDYQKIVEIDPKDIRNRQKLAELLNRNRQVEEALEEYEAVARYYSENGFYLKAIAVYKQMQRIDPSQVRIYHRLAELNEKQGLTGNALAEYRGLISYYEQHDMLSEVINVLQKMKDLDPENLNVLVKMAEAYARGGMQDKAREEFLDVVERLRDKDEYAKILKLCELLIPFFPDNPEALTARAEALLATGAAEQAVPLLEDVTGRKPEVFSLELLARARREVGDLPGEVEARRRVLELVPDDLGRHLDYVDALLAAGLDQDALEELEEWKDSCVQADMTARVKGCYERLRAQLGDDQRVTATLRAIYEMTGEGDKLFDLMSDREGEEPDETGLDDDLEILGDGLVEEALSDLEEVAITEAAASGPGQDEGGFEPAASGMDVSTDGEGEEPVAESPDGENGPKAPESAEENEEAEEPDEVPLEFLEEVAEDAVDNEVAASVPKEAEGGISLEELDVEGGEFELELELDIELEGDENQPGDIDLTAEEAAEEEVAEEAVAEEAVAEEAVAEEAVAEEAVAEEAVAEEAVAEEAVAEEAVLELSEEPEAEVELVEEEIELVDEEPADVNALLDEAAFYLQQNLHDDAERLCRQVLEADPGNSRASLLVQEIEAARQPGDEEEEGLDWDGALKEVLGDSLGTIDAEDADSHYNLGIAYKEMGLLDDAIKEFETAMAHPSRRISSLTLKALCLIETGDTTGAEEALRLGLACPDLTGEEKLNLLFEMGQLKETAGSDQEALDWFLKVAGEDHFYRDVGLRIRQLRSRLGLPDDGLDGTPGTRGQDKVSYL